MAINRYFENFPVISYSNNEVLDITKRVAILDTVSGDPYLFYPYEIVESERPDQFSTRYYKDPFKSWMLYLTNKMTDPYHEWYKTQRELEEFCAKKYGDLFNARNKIKYYQNDYLSEETISTSRFETLPQDLKKYWVPNYDVNNKIIEYVRRKAEWTTTTNKIVKYTLNEANTYIRDEVVDIYYDSNNSGKGQVLSVQGDTIYIQHVSGQYFTTETVDTDPGSYIYGRESETKSLFTNFAYVANCIPDAELIYWREVSCFDYENEKNEFNKTVSVLDSRFAKTMSDNLRILMRE